jgi:predicted RNase H-like nuclease (RuvC/YqgF family)
LGSPTLVGLDEQGRPATVRNEVHRQEAELTELRKQMSQRDRRLEDLERRLEVLAREKRFR